MHWGGKYWRKFIFITLGWGLATCWALLRNIPLKTFLAKTIYLIYRVHEKQKHHDQQAREHGNRSSSNFLRETQWYTSTSVSCISPQLCRPYIFLIMLCHKQSSWVENRLDSYHPSGWCYSLNTLDDVTLPMENLKLMDAQDEIEVTDIKIITEISATFQERMPRHLVTMRRQTYQEELFY